MSMNAYRTPAPPASAPVALSGDIGIFVGLVAYAFIGVALAIRRAQTSPADEIQAYEEKLLRKRYR